MGGNVAVLAKPQAEEVHVQRGDVSLCLLVNRRARTLRIIDYRSGPSVLKREIVRRAALEAGVERAFTVVEREEAPGWARLGFRKEGTLPGFYKRTDAVLLGQSFGSAPNDTPRSRTETAAFDSVERAYQAARRLFRTRSPEELPAIKLQPARPADVLRCLAAANQSGRALTELEPFGRGSERSSYLATGRGGFSLLLSVECQPCFDNALVEPLTAPRSEKEAWSTAAALRLLAPILEQQGALSVFALTPGPLPELSAALLRAGFRRTGRLERHLLQGGERCDALLWSCKLAELGRG